MKQKNTDIPFDIGNYRVLDYTPFKFEDAKDNLISILKESDEDKFPHDSPVVDTLGDYEIIYKTKPLDDTMSWDYYFAKIKRIADILRVAHREGDLTVCGKTSP